MIISIDSADPDHSDISIQTISHSSAGGKFKTGNILMYGLGPILLITGFLCNKYEIQIRDRLIEVPAVVEESGRDDPWYSNHYGIYVVYKFEYRNQKISHRATNVVYHTDNEADQELKNTYRTGATITVHCDPADLSRSYLYSAGPIVGYILMILGAAYLLLSPMLPFVRDPAVLTPPRPRWQYVLLFVYFGFVVLAAAGFGVWMAVY